METAAIVPYDETLEALMERVDVNAPQRLTFRADPPRAIRLLEYAISRPKIRNPAAFALTRFRAGQDAPGYQAPAIPEAPPEPADLEAALEYARANGAPSFAIAAIEAQLSAARAAQALEEGATLET